MNNCLCESCCDKDYCLSYQDYKNSDGIVAEPITACGRYKKLHTVEDTYTKADLKSILVELQLQMEEYKPKWVENDEQAVASCRTWEDLDGIIQNKINTLEEQKDEINKSNK